MVIYRPPSSPITLFIQELTKLFEDACLGDHNTIVAGDMNIHFENDSDTHNKQYKELLQAFDLKQYVANPTHLKGHILDHIIAKSSGAITVSSVHLGANISDHSTVLCDISFSKPRTSD